MRRRIAAAGVGAIVTISGICGFVVDAAADAPREARIVEGHSMAGVILNSHVRLASTSDRVRDGVLAGWGVMRGGTCFEGSNCSWAVASGATVEVILDARNSRVQRIAANAPGWRTDRGIGRGSTTRSLRRVYGRRIVRRTTCGLNGFGGDSTGFVMNSRHRGERRFTFFELSASRQVVSRVWIGRGRVVQGTRC
ncbi:MAG: hypothetical protein ACR2H2_19810 [Solirubrobacteraceae bacterium]